MSETDNPKPTELKKLSPAAERALAEAAQRREATDRAAAGQPKQAGARSDGLDPTRYGDWEKKGLASDF
jgi:hypothetical protein